MTLLTFSTMRHSCVASISCCLFPISGSITNASRMSLLPVCMQSTPSREFFSVTCRLLMLASAAIGDSPEFSASVIGIWSSASANARMAYCSRPGDSIAASSTAMEHAISAAPPPYTTRLSRTRLRTTHRASWSERLASSMIWRVVSSHVWIH